MPDLPRGIVPVVQTPFHRSGEIDWTGLERLVEDAIAAGAAGFLAPVVASEVAFLSLEERRQIVRRLASRLAGRVPLIVGASADDPNLSREFGALAEEVHAAAWLVAVPQQGYAQLDSLPAFFAAATQQRRLPLIIQDLQFQGPGLPVETIVDLRRRYPLIQGIKIETVPAGPKYTAVRKACGPELFISGGWAVPQMIEAQDRSVDAMIPECSMVRVYRRVYDLHVAGEREKAVQLFRRLSPVLAFANQELATSIAFFKRLLVRKKIFPDDTLRIPGFVWDEHNSRIADELIDLYLALEAEVITSARP